MVNFTILLQGAYLLTGLVFLYYGLSKLLTPGYTFAASVHEYRILPSRAVIPFAKTLPVVEVVVALMLFTPGLSGFALPFVAGLTIMFEIALGKAILTGLRIECGCSGKSTKLSREEQPGLIFAFIRNLIILAVLSGTYVLSAQVTSFIPLMVLVVGLVLFGFFKIVSTSKSSFSESSTSLMVGDSLGLTKVNTRRGFLRTMGTAGAFLSLVAVSGFTFLRSAEAAACIPPANCVAIGPYIGTYLDCSGCHCTRPCMGCMSQEYDLHYLICDDGSGIHCGTIPFYNGIWIVCCETDC